MKVISFFNHKGGVSKTTTVYHVAWMLNEMGKRVLMVDTDSQCNLTLTCIGEDQYEDFVQKMVDIHPPKTGISVHFSDSFILMALQI